MQFTGKLWIPSLIFPLSNFLQLERLPLSFLPCISKKPNSFLFPEIFYEKKKIPFLLAPTCQETQNSTSKPKQSLVVDSSLLGYAILCSGTHSLTRLHRNISTSSTTFTILSTSTRSMQLQQEAAYVQGY